MAFKDTGFKLELLTYGKDKGLIYDKRDILDRIEWVLSYGDIVVDNGQILEKDIKVHKIIGVNFPKRLFLKRCKDRILDKVRLYNSNMPVSPQFRLYPTEFPHITNIRKYKITYHISQ